MDSPFEIYKNEADLTVLTSLLAVEQYTIPKSLYYSNIGFNFDITDSWAFVLMHHQFQLYNFSPSQVIEKFKSMFDINDDDLQNIEVSKINKGLENQKNQQQWNLFMNIIVSSLTLYLSSTTKYSLDSQDCLLWNDELNMECLGSLDNDRVNGYEFPGEGTIDCEDGSFILVSFFNKINTAFQSINDTFTQFTSEEQNFIFIIRFMMNQYIPVMCLTETKPILSQSKSNEMFYHMGGLLLGKLYFLEMVSGDKIENEVTKVQDITYKKLNHNSESMFVKHEYIKPLVLESTSMIFADPSINILSDLENCFDSVDDVQKEFLNCDGIRLNMPSYKNIQLGEKCFSDYYNRILAIYTDAFTNSLIPQIPISASTFFVRNGDDLSVSLSDLLNYNNDDKLRIKNNMFLYFKCEFPEEIREKSNAILKMISRKHNFDCDHKLYLSLIDTKDKDKIKNKPMSLVLVTCEKTGQNQNGFSSSISILPVSLTNNESMESNGVKKTISENDDFNLNFNVYQNP